MLSDNNTPLAALAFDQWHPNGMTMAVIVARGRIRVDPDGSQFFVEGTELVLADEFSGDPHKSSMLRGNDLIPFKPFADITLKATLQSSEPAEFITGEIHIGDVSASIRGCGSRYWYYDRGWKLSTPKPISELSLCYTKSSGGRYIGDPDGRVDPRNPIGSGVIDSEYTPQTLDIPAPQIDSIAAPISLDPTKPAIPQGVGPIPPWWEDRQQYVGTYDDEWAEKVHPRLPQDFDYRHYQVAPKELILGHYLLPGMELQTKGFRPNGKDFTVQIPDIMPFATFSFSDGRVVQVRLHMDGIHLDLTSAVPTYDLTWRSWIETCPSLYRVDLNLERSENVMKMMLPVAGEFGLQVDKENDAGR